ncbi:MAG: UDP-N-acetylmuramate dehydrogenase [Steroidobacteraceae bacterium]
MSHPAPWKLERDVSLAARNTLRVEARALRHAVVRDPSALPSLLAHDEVAGGPVMVLGQGSNVLFAGDFDGLVIEPAWRRVHVVLEDDDGAIVRADAGASWDGLVDWSLASGYAGLENLALIPGLVGAAPIQNIGAYGSEVGEFVTTVEAYDRSTATLRRLAAVDCAFGYRDSLFKRDADRWIVTALELRLARTREPNLGYGGLREELAARRIERPTPPQVAQAVRQLRRRKLPDPAAIGNAGSFFKNPVVPAATAASLALGHPGLPVHPAGPGQAKLSAAWLIEDAGLKGYRVGDAGVSAQHALVLVNHGHASGDELLAVARHVAATVEARHGVRLEPEPRIVGATF